MVHIQKINKMIEINKNYNENCLDTLSKVPNNTIDLTVTSPPYDNLRDYKGYVQSRLFDPLELTVNIFFR